MKTANWIGVKDLRFVLILLEVLHIFMKNLFLILCIETLKLVIYFLIKTSTQKLETLGWPNFFQMILLTLAQELLEQRMFIFPVDCYLLSDIAFILLSFSIREFLFCELLNLLLMSVVSLVKCVLKCKGSMGLVH